jgi:hypothetical protein
VHVFVAVDVSVREDAPAHRSPSRCAFRSRAKNCDRDFDRDNRDHDHD